MISGCRTFAENRDEDMLNEEEKAEKLASALHPSLISSEESDGETIVIRPLKWRNGEVNNFLKELDKRWFGLMDCLLNRKGKLLKEQMDRDLKETIV